MNQHDSLVFEVHESLDLREVRDLLQPCVSFPVPSFPSLPPMEVEWDYGHRWGSVKPIPDDGEVSEVSPPEPPSPAPSRPELHLVETFYEPSEIVLTFREKPTGAQARVMVELLKSHPGDQPVYLVVGDKEMALRGTRCAADEDILEQLRTTIRCDVQVRQVA
jgi:hypothetical protein